MNFRRTKASVLTLLVVTGALAGERAQTSGARRADGEKKEEIPTAQAEAERVGVMNRLLRNRQFDVLRSGNSLGGAIEIPMQMPAPSSAPVMDPKSQKRILDELDRRKNWLVEPGSTTPRELEKSVDPSRDTPDFSRDRNRPRSRREIDSDPDTSGRDMEGRAGSRLSAREAKDRRRPGDSEERTKDLREDAGRPDRLEESLTLSARDSVRLERDSQITGTGGRPQSWFQFGTGRGDSASSGQDISAHAGGGFGTKEFLNPNSDPGAAKAFGGGVSDPGGRFDPTVVPALPFSVRDDAPFARSDTFAAPAALPGSGAGSGFGTSAGFGAFGGGPAASARPAFLGPISTPDPVPAARAPVFEPRPAVLSVGPPKVF